MEHRSSSESPTRFDFNEEEISVIAVEEFHLPFDEHFAGSIHFLKLNHKLATSSLAYEFQVPSLLDFKDSNFIQNYWRTHFDHLRLAENSMLMSKILDGH